MSARAVASEQLSGQIVDSITAGLLVVDGSGRVEILNPAGRRMLEAMGEAVGRDYRELLASAPPLQRCDCRMSGDRPRDRPPIGRDSRASAASLHFGVTVSPLRPRAAEARSASSPI